MKNKTIAAWLALIGGPLGLHRFYLNGWGDTLGWLLPVPTTLGLYGIARAQQHGLDDLWSWLLIPVLGFTFAGCALNAIVYGLMMPDRWNARFNPWADVAAPHGQTNWFTIAAVALALLLGTAALMTSTVLTFQHYFEYQIRQASTVSG